MLDRYAKVDYEGHLFRGVIYYQHNKNQNTENQESHLKSTHIQNNRMGCQIQKQVIVLLTPHCLKQDETWTF